MVSIVDDLRAKAQNARDDIQHYRGAIATDERNIAAYREKIDAAELEAAG